MTENRLLSRQLKKAKIDTIDDVDERSFQKFLHLIERSYEDAEEDKLLYENVTKVASREFQELNKNLEYKVEELEKINSSIKDSIEYASLMQQAILPEKKTLDSFFDNYFICWQPRDIVGGDIYFINKFDEDKLLIMVLDGAGHGVSGAFLTMLVKAIEGQIMAKIREGSLNPSPALILEYFNRHVKEMLKQEKESESNSGFDGGILYYDQEAKICKYAGAKTPLYILDDGELAIIKSDRKSVGFKRIDYDQKYTDYEIPFKRGKKLYITTDGLLDQEGKNNRRYGAEQFKQFLLDNHTNPFSTQFDLLKKSLMDFKGDCKQSDDVTVLGLEFK